jgi:virulence-associated protein VapD
MKIKLSALFVLIGISAALVGCVNTVGGTKTTAVPFLKDRVEARYERSLDQVFSAAKDVLARNGAIARAGTLYNQTNDIRVLEGKVKQATVWIRVESVEAHLTGVTVQSRTSRGGADLALAHEIDKEIALQLAR